MGKVRSKSALRKRLRYHLQLIKVFFARGGGLKIVDRFVKVSVR